MEEKAKYFEDYQLGEKRVTGAKTITEADIIIHAGQTGDFFPHHIDAEFAKTTPFGQRIAHGTLTFSVGVGLTASFINPVAFSYGYDHLRFIRPVFIGDTIHTEVTITDKYDNKKHPDKGMVVEGLAVINQHGQTVMVANHLLMCDRRELAKAGLAG
jgi:acyl dehydratase